MKRVALQPSVSWVLALSALIFSSPFISRSALARDSQELVCSGSAKLLYQDGTSEKLPFFVSLLDSRAEDGMARNQTLSTVYQGDLFQGHYLNVLGGNPKNAPIELRNPAHPEQVLLKGQYTLVETSGSYAIYLSGLATDDPSHTADPEFGSVTAKLPCVDISD